MAANRLTRLRFELLAVSPMADLPFVAAAPLPLDSGATCCVVGIDRFLAYFHHGAIGQHDLQTLDVSAGRTVFQPVTARGVQAMTLPIVVTLLLAGSGPNTRPKLCRCSFSNA